MTQTLEAEFAKQLKKDEYLYTRLRTPNYGFRGVRYPADFVVWMENGTFLIECKERQSLPLAPSDIRQMPFMVEWQSKRPLPQADYWLLVKNNEDGKYYIFSSFKAVKAKENRKSLREEDALFFSEKMSEIVNYMKEY